MNRESDAVAGFHCIIIRDQNPPRSQDRFVNAHVTGAFREGCTGKGPPALSTANQTDESANTRQLSSDRQLCEEELNLDSFGLVWGGSHG